MVLGILNSLCLRQYVGANLYRNVKVLLIVFKKIDHCCFLKIHFFIIKSQGCYHYPLIKTKIKLYSSFYKEEIK